jgi:ABC-2 type transport system permease protein
MSALAIAGVNLRRLARDRTSLFFVFLLPVVLLVVLGTIYGGRVAPRMGVVAADAGPLGDELVEAIRDGDLALEMFDLDDEARLRDQVASGRIEIGLVIPPGYDATLRGGGTAEVTIVGQPTAALSALGRAVAAAIADQGARIRAARLAGAEVGTPFDPAYAAAAGVQAGMPGVSVELEQIGEGIFPADAGAFEPGAQSQLVLFMFLTSMTAAVQLILTRQYGVSRRMAASPVSVRTILVGETLGRFAVAMVQGLFIVGLSALVFAVDWGDPLAAGLVVVLFALVGSGAAMVVGVFANNADQAGALAVAVGMIAGALGGAMVPLEIFGEPMRTIAHVTPHAWAIEGLRATAFADAGVTGILPQIAALCLMAAVLLGLGIWRFRRLLTS